MAKEIDLSAPTNRMALLAIALGLVGGIAALSAPSKANPRAEGTAAGSSDMCTIVAHITDDTQRSKALMNAAIGCKQARR